MKKNKIHLSHIHHFFNNNNNNNNKTRKRGRRIKIKKEDTPCPLHHPVTTESERLYFHLSPDRKSSKTFGFFHKRGEGERKGEGRVETRL